MSTIRRIGNALGYDVPETMLSEGCSLASVYAFAVALGDDAANQGDNVTPLSLAPTMMIETVRPVKVA